MSRPASNPSPPDQTSEGTELGDQLTVRELAKFLKRLREITPGAEKWASTWRSACAPF